MFIYKLEKVFLTQLGRMWAGFLLREKKKARTRSGGKIELLSRKREKGGLEERNLTTQRSLKPAES